MTITASFAGSTLSVLGDSFNNNITTSRTAGGTLQVNGGAVAVTGGTPTVANTGLISILAGSGNDSITLNETNGALPAAAISGEAGSDTLNGGSAGDQLFGGLDADTLFGKGGNDTLFGGDGADTLNGGDGNDVVLGEAGDDTFIWTAGHDSDVFEGGDGIDTAQTTGGNGAEIFVVSANGARVRLERVDPAPFVTDIGSTERLVLNPNGGADAVLVNDLSGTPVQQVLINLGVGGGSLGDGEEDAVSIFAGAGNNRISISTFFLTATYAVTGAELDDTILLDAGAGSDTIVAGSFAHAITINGGTESDTVSYEDSIVGLTVNLDLPALNTGNAAAHTYISIESVIGSAFDDVLTGNAEANTLDGGGGADLLTGLGGDDLYIVDNAADIVSETAGGGTLDQVFVAGMSYALSGTTDIEVLRTLDQTSAIALNLFGSSASQSITGNRGANKLKGLGGDDTLAGNQGKDTLVGGDGRDSFVFSTKLKSTNIDLIKGYVRADDTIILDNDIFTALTTTGKLAKSAFHASTSGTAHDATDRILYDTDNGKLYYDKDGTGHAHAVQFATLQTHPTIGANDFSIV
jgi:Ca2+-binding RTX toxin-like protein